MVVCILRDLIRELRMLFWHSSLVRWYQVSVALHHSGSLPTHLLQVVALASMTMLHGQLLLLWCLLLIPSAMLHKDSWLIDRMLPAPPNLACGLLQWESSTNPLSAAFHSLSPPLLAKEHYRNVEDVISHLVLAVNLCTLIPDLVCKHKHCQLQMFCEQAPPDLAVVLPSILEHYTREGHLHMSHRHRNHCLLSPYSGLFICIKLFLPILGGHHIVCGCGKVVDAHGIHFFKCHQYHPKTPFHN